MIESGRVVLKIAGREAGRYAVVLETASEGFVMITGPKSVTGVKRRKCNIEHIEPTQHKLEIDSKADDSAIENSWKNSDLIEKLGIEIPRKRTKEAKESKEAKDKPVKKQKK
jgi:large subunit ribosomal protein L14e